MRRPDNQRHLLSLINDLLEFVKIEGGQVEYHFRDVPVNAALLGLDGLIAPQVQRKELRYIYRPCDPQLAVRADQDKIQQVLLNLLSNAIKFTDAGGGIMLESEVDDERVAIHVRDTGRGTPPEKLQSIFEPFGQVDRAGAGDQPHTGARHARRRGGGQRARQGIDVHRVAGARRGGAGRVGLTCVTAAALGGSPP
ncbi:MAG: HAMP domain-containing histidine kinase [Gemmatimonadetes bacterium]|nr:HAMP domain-containing histidine kinase [Gemmatimonadota bacterium]